MHHLTAIGLNLAFSDNLGNDPRAIFHKCLSRVPVKAQGVQAESTDVPSAYGLLTKYFTTMVIQPVLEFLDRIFNQFNAWLPKRLLYPVYSGNSGAHSLVFRVLTRRGAEY